MKFCVQVQFYTCRKGNIKGSSEYETMVTVIEEISEDANVGIV